MNESAQDASRAPRTLPSLVDAEPDDDTGPATPFTPRTCALVRVRLRMRIADLLASLRGVIGRWTARLVGR